MSDDLFHHVLSADKSKLKLVLHEAELELSAEQVVRLALFFANLRAEMLPAVSETFPGPQESAQSDYCEIQGHPTGESEIRLRIPGLCWVYSYLSKDRSLRICETLNPPTSIPSNATVN